MVVKEAVTTHTCYVTLCFNLYQVMTMSYGEQLDLILKLCGSAVTLQSPYN